MRESRKDVFFMRQSRVGKSGCGTATLACMIDFCKLFHENQSFSSVVPF
jgi:hypothetical protein